MYAAPFIEARLRWSTTLGLTQSIVSLAHEWCDQTMNNYYHVYKKYNLQLTKMNRALYNYNYGTQFKWKTHDN